METVMFTIGLIGFALAIISKFKISGGLLALLGFTAYFFLTPTDSWVPIIIFSFGLLLLILELFLPDFGIVGILGFVVTFFGAYLTTGSLNQSLIDFIIGLIIAGGISYIAIKRGYTVGKFDEWTLKSTDRSSNYSKSQKYPELSPGMFGKSTTSLRPSGKVIFDDLDQTYDVISTTGHIASGQTVILEKIQGYKIYVKTSSSGG